MQICTRFGRFCKFFDRKFAKWLPGISEESVDSLLIDRLFETIHEDEQVLDGNVSSGSMVESLVDFLCCHNRVGLIGL